MCLYVTCILCDAGLPDDDQTTCPRDRLALLDTMFSLAKQHGLMLDFHVDENGNEESRGLRDIAQKTIEHGYQGNVVCGHCWCVPLASQSCQSVFAATPHSTSLTDAFASGLLLILRRDTADCESWSDTMAARHPPVLIVAAGPSGGAQIDSVFKAIVLCSSLAWQPPAELAKTLDLAAMARVTLVSLPLVNEWTQDRTAASPARTPRWRGVTALHEAAAAGVRVALASDNTRDQFYQYGDLDMLEVFTQVQTAATCCLTLPECSAVHGSKCW